MIDAATRAARRKVEKLVAAAGGTVDASVEGHSYSVSVTAPNGMHWADGLHEYVGSIFVGPWSYADVWLDLLARVEGNAPERCDGGCEFWGE